MVGTWYNQILMDASIKAIKEHEFYEAYDILLPNSSINIDKYLSKNGQIYN